MRSVQLVNSNDNIRQTSQIFRQWIQDSKIVEKTDQLLSAIRSKCEKATPLSKLEKTQLQHLNSPANRVILGDVRSAQAQTVGTQLLTINFLKHWDGDPKNSDLAHCGVDLHQLLDNLNQIDFTQIEHIQDDHDDYLPGARSTLHHQMGIPASFDSFYPAQPDTETFASGTKLLTLLKLAELDHPLSERAVQFNQHYYRSEQSILWWSDMIGFCDHYGFPEPNSGMIPFINGRLHSALLEDEGSALDDMLDASLSLLASPIPSIDNKALLIAEWLNYIVEAQISWENRSHLDKIKTARPSIEAKLGGPELTWLRQTPLFQGQELNQLILDLERFLNLPETEPLPMDVDN